MMKPINYYSKSKYNTRKNDEQLIRLVKKLSKEVKSLQNRVTDLENQQKPKKKIDPIIWLNENCLMNPSLQEFINKTSISEYFIDKIINNENLFSVLESFLKEKLQDINNSPFVSFSHRPNIIYVKQDITQETQQAQNIWTALEKKELIHMMNVFQIQALNKLHAWKKEMQRSMDEDSLATIYNKSMRKILVSYQDATVIAKVRRIIYDIVLMHE